MNPTREQQAAIEAFLEGRNMKINAYAGSGKTSTLKMLAREKVSPGVYLCFNKSIAEDAQKSFPETVACKTTHSFAYRAVIPTYRKNSSKMVNSLRARDTADALRIKEIRTFGGTDSIEPTTLAYAVNQTVRRFCQSADKEVEPWHFECLPKFKMLEREEFDFVKARVINWASQLWNLAIDPDSDIPFGHDGYVKIWQLSEPIIDTCFILVDEAQDTNPVMLDILKRQEAQVVYVGDRHQQIYEWRGAVNAMETAAVSTTVNLTKSFRFGQAIADAASNILAKIGEENRIIGNENIDSRITAESQKTVLCRTNAEILSRLLTLEEFHPGKSVYVVGGVDDILRTIEGIDRLQAGKTSAYPLFLGFKDWDEFCLYAKNSGDGDANKIVKLTDKYDIHELKSALENVYPSEAKAEVLLTTAHKSKGREWQGVELADDFKPQPEKNENGELEHNKAETRLFYVAATRAINTLKVPQWARDTYGLDFGSGRQAE